MTPLRPPIVNIAIKETENSIAVLYLMLPPHSVPSQLKIFTPVGTAISIVDTAKAVLAAGPRPTVNIWWLHTNHPMNPMTIPANTTNAYPNKGLRAKVGSTSETIPIAGSIKM